jgi:hypothetical protein
MPNKFGQRRAVRFIKKRSKILRKWLSVNIMYVDDELSIGKLGISCSLLAEPIAKQLAKEDKVKVWRGVDLTVDLNFGSLKKKKKDTMILKLISILNKIWWES